MKQMMREQAEVEEDPSHGFTEETLVGRTVGHSQAARLSGSTTNVIRNMNSALGSFPTWGPPSHPAAGAESFPTGGSTEVECSPIDGVTGLWWVLHTKSRHEKALAWDLEQKGAHWFLPLVRTQKNQGGRRVDVELPLFPGYVFLCGTEDDRYAALTTHRVAHVIQVVDQERLRAELRQIHRVLESNEPIDLYPGLRQGRRCRVAAGSLRGLEGVVLRRRGMSRMYLEVGILGQSAVVEIDAMLLEAID